MYLVCFHKIKNSSAIPVECFNDSPTHLSTNLRTWQQGSEEEGRQFQQNSAIFSQHSEHDKPWDLTVEMDKKARQF